MTQPLSLNHDDLKHLLSGITEDARIICPVCGPTRKKSNEKTMAVTVKPDIVLYHCHHCDEKGGIPTRDSLRSITAQVRQPVTTNKKVVAIPTPEDNPSLVKQALEARQIPLVDKVLDHYPMVGGTHYFREAGGEVPAIGFVYGDKAKPNGIKWRSIDGKHFAFQGRAESFYGIESCEANSNVVVLCEGEYDALAIAAAGHHALSVPYGAPNRLSDKHVIDPANDGKYQCIWKAKELINNADKIILAFDSDDAGKILGKEFMRRIDIAKCWEVSYPDDCKDANDVLAKHGLDKLAECIDSAKAVPLEGVYSADEYDNDVMHLYSNGLGRGASTGYMDVDNLFTLAPGLYVVTGVPSSGKSEFVDQLMINAANLHGWKWAVCSFENPVRYHIAKLAEKVIKKPFFTGHQQQRMTEEDINTAKTFINNHFVFLDQKDDSPATISSIIDRTKQAVMRLGVRGLVIDPYNYVDMTGNGKEEHLSISDMLTVITRFAKAHGLLVFFVAHPTKLYENSSGQFPVPTGQHISGSAAWFAKADVGITVQRDANDNSEVHCWKVRFKWIGRQGKTTLGYDLPTGTYSELLTPVSNGFASTRLRAPAHYLDDIDEKDLNF
jgi:twinkle protein